MPIDPTKARVECEFKHGSPFVGCRFDPTGRFLFAGAQDNTIQRFDLVTGTAASLAGHASWVRSFAFVTESAAGSAELDDALRLRDTAVAAVGFGAAPASSLRSRSAWAWTKADNWSILPGTVTGFSWSDICCGTIRPS